MRKSRAIAVAASSATLALGLALAPMASASASTGIRYGGVLHTAMSWTTIPDDFNPLLPGTTSDTAGGTGSLVYENLFYDNTYTGKLTGILGTAYKWSNGNKTLTVTTRNGVKWSDGMPFSAADVAFTFNYIKKYPGLDGTGIWESPSTLKSVTAPSSDRVVFNFNAPDTTEFLSAIVGQKIVPEHIWSKITNPVTFTNPHPVGTGPFLLNSYSPTLVSYVKNPRYWVPGKPYINGVTMEAVKSDTTVQLLLTRDDIAFSDDYIFDAPRSYVAADPAYNHYWWPSTGLNFLYMNDAVAPFNAVYFRQAIAMAINDNVVAERAYFGSISPATGPVETGVISGQASVWVPPSVRAREYKYNPSAALRLLESHGYKLVNGNLEAPDGSPLPTFNILVGSGWSDFISMAQTAGQELLALGIHTTVQQEPYSTYASMQDYGHYSMFIGWGNGNNATPYYEYYYLLSPTETAPIGKLANTNWERYTSPNVTAALTQYSRTTNLAVQKADIAIVEKNILANVPVIPLTGRPSSFFDYSTKYFVGWPTAANPYETGNPPDDFSGCAELMYLNVHLK
jgi:peptide/nickel transport system substrate-binding protein